MKAKIAGAVALVLALTQIAAAPAYAEQAASPFRAPAAQSFSAQDLQNYGLDANATQRAMDLQNQGYQIKVLTPEQAHSYQAGITDTQWLLLGILAGVIVIAVAAD